jgi:hypothetical protein
MEWSYIRACQKQQALNCTRGHSSARRCTSESERDHLCALFIPHRRRCLEATPILQAAQPPYPQSHTKLRGSAPFQQPRGLASMNPMYAQHHDGVEEAPATAALGAAENAQALVHSSEIREEERRPAPPSRSLLWVYFMGVLSTVPRSCKSGWPTDSGGGLRPTGRPS